jgi:hypothetical protein
MPLQRHGAPGFRVRLVERTLRRRREALGTLTMIGTVRVRRTDLSEVAEVRAVRGSPAADQTRRRVRETSRPQSGLRVARHVGAATRLVALTPAGSQAPASSSCCGTAL